MRAYLAIKYHADQRNRSEIEAISRMLESVGIETVCAARDLEKWGEIQYAPEILMMKSFSEIEVCDLMLVELSEKGVGIGIEAGYGHARKIPIITIAKTGRDISETLRGISSQVTTYDKVEDLKPFFTQLAN